MTKIWTTYKNFIALSTIHRSELVSIQWLRGIAVMMVFIYHMEDILNLMPGFESFHSTWQNYGYSAPDLFFVISGFIMCFVTFELKFKPIGWLVRRVLRIYPIFLIFAALSISVWLINPEMTMGSGAQDWSSILKFLLLMPQENMPLLFVTWTLEHEIVFYTLVFVVATLGGKSRSVIIIMGILSIIALLKAALKDTYPVLDFWDYHLFSLYIIQFFIGALIFETQKNLSKINGKLLVSAGLALFFVAGIICEPAPLNEEHILKVLMFGVSFGLIMIGAINLEIKKRKEIDGYIEYKRRPFLVQMGDASYSIYLSHPFCFSIVGKITAALSLSGILTTITILFGSLLSLILGWLVYHCIEKPMMHTSKLILTRHKKKKEAPLPNT